MKNFLWSLMALALLVGCAFLGGCANRTQPLPPSVLQRVKDLEPVPGEGRPGLSTSLGTQRVSLVEPTTFTRAHSRPQSAAALYYNDRAGINAILDYLGGEPRRAVGWLSAGDVAFGVRDVESGGWLEGWELKGRRFVVGERGRRYEIVVKNQSAQPVEVVVAVDGLDVLDHERGSVEKKRGYVLDAREEFAIKGFRANNEMVNAFLFGPVAESYAQQRLKDTRNVGVIGMAVFREGRPAPRNPLGPRPLRPAKEEEPPKNREAMKPIQEA
jgi:hypothetical protein